MPGQWHRPPARSRQLPDALPSQQQLVTEGSSGEHLPPNEFGPIDAAPTALDRLDSELRKLPVVAWRGGSDQVQRECDALGTPIEPAALVDVDEAGVVARIEGQCRIDERQQIEGFVGVSIEQSSLPAHDAFQRAHLRTRQIGDHNTGSLDEPSVVERPIDQLDGRRRTPFHTPDDGAARAPVKARYLVGLADPQRATDEHQRAIPTQRRPQPSLGLAAINPRPLSAGTSGTSAAHGCDSSQGPSPGVGCRCETRRTLRRSSSKTQGGGRKADETTMAASTATPTPRSNMLKTFGTAAARH